MPEERDILRTANELARRCDLPGLPPPYDHLLVRETFLRAARSLLVRDEQAYLAAMDQISGIYGDTITLPPNPFAGHLPEESDEARGGL